MPVTLRQIKGSDLTPSEADANFALLGGGLPPPTVVVNNGTIDLTGIRGGFYRVDTEGGGASDDVHTITGLLTTDVVKFMAVNASRTVRFLHQSAGGNLWMNPPEFTLNSLRDHITFFHDGTAVVEDHRLSILG